MGGSSQSPGRMPCGASAALPRGGPRRRARVMLIILAHALSAQTVPLRALSAAVCRLFAATHQARDTRHPFRSPCGCGAHDALGAACQPVAGFSVCAAHAGVVPHPAGLRSPCAPAARWRRPGADRPGAGCLQPHARAAAIALRHGIRPVRAQAGDHFRIAALCGGQRGSGLGHRSQHHDHRPGAARHGRHFRCGYRLHRRSHSRLSTHQGHGPGGRVHRTHVCAVAGGRAAAVRVSRHVRHVSSHRSDGAGGYRRRDLGGPSLGWPDAGTRHAAAHFVCDGPAGRRADASEPGHLLSAHGANGDVRRLAGLACRTCRTAAGRSLENVSAGGRGVLCPHVTTPWLGRAQRASAHGLSRLSGAGVGRTAGLCGAAGRDRTVRSAVAGVFWRIQCA